MRPTLARNSMEIANFSLVEIQILFKAKNLLVNSFHPQISTKRIFEISCAEGAENF